MRPCRLGPGCVAAFALFALFALLAGELPVRAQSVTTSAQGYGSTIRSGDSAADKQGRAEWPRILAGESGTQVHVTFDLRNADVTLNTGRDYPLPQLLTEAKTVAGRLKLPEADFITFQGSKTSNVDIELNDYLRFRGRNQSEFDLDLAALARALEVTALPRPVVVRVDAENADSVTLSAGGTSRPLTGDAFFGVNEVAPDARLHFAVTIRPSEYAAAYGLVALFAVLLGVPIGVPWFIKRRTPAVPPSPATPPDPAEVQERYNRQKPFWVTFTGSLVAGPLFALAILFPLIKASSRAMPYILPEAVSSPRSVLLLAPAGFAVFFASSALARLVQKRRGDAPPPPPTADAEDTPPQWTQTGFLIPMMAGMCLMPLLLFLPGLSRLESHWRVAVVFGVEALCFVAAAVVGLRGARANRTDLGPDSPWHGMVQEVAAQAGTRVRHVVIVRSPALNAYASLFGTVGLTSALLRKMEPDEVRAVVAHEVGHLQAGHVRKTLAVTLPLLAVWLTLLFVALPRLKGHVPLPVYAILSSPLPGMLFGTLVVPLVAGRGQRRREEEADRFAVEATGDPELVIRTLRKLHTLNASPHHLKPSDEALMAHPSLAHRIESIRRDHPTPGGV